MSHSLIHLQKNSLKKKIKLTDLLILVASALLTSVLDPALSTSSLVSVSSTIPLPSAVVSIVTVTEVVVVPAALPTVVDSLTSSILPVVSSVVNGK